MAKKLRKLALEKACEVLLFYIQHADHSEEATFELVFDEGEINEEESDILYLELNQFDSFSKLLKGECYVISKNELDEMYNDLSSLTESI